MIYKANLPIKAFELIPYLAVTGLQDHAFLELDVVDELCSRRPNLKRVDFKEAGHLISAETPEKLASTLALFAKEVV